MRRLDKQQALAALAEARASIPPQFRQCVMCALAASAMKPNLFIRETEHAVCVLNAFGSMPADMLVVAKRHLPTLGEVPWEVHEDMSRLAWEAGRVLERRGAKRVYLAQLGSPADIPTSYAHAHVHVIPVTTTDEGARPAVVLSWSSGVIAYDPGEGEALAASLAASFHESPSTVTGRFRRSKS